MFSAIRRTSTAQLATQFKICCFTDEKESFLLREEAEKEAKEMNLNSVRVAWEGKRLLSGFTG